MLSIDVYHGLEVAFAQLVFVDLVDFQLSVSESTFSYSEMPART